LRGERRETDRSEWASSNSSDLSFGGDHNRRSPDRSVPLPGVSALDPQRQPQSFHQDGDHIIPATVKGPVGPQLDELSDGLTSSHLSRKIAEQEQPPTGIFWADFETLSRLKLKLLGSASYLRHKRHTRPLLLFWAVNDGPFAVWKWGEPIEPLRAAIKDRLFVSHGAFDRICWNEHLVPLGLPPIPIEHSDDCMVRCQKAGIPSGLDKAAAALRFPPELQKLDDRTMRELSRPREPRPDEDPDGLYALEDPEKLEKLIKYGKRDGKVRRAVYNALPPLTELDRLDWINSEQINEAGLYLDGLVIEKACGLIDIAKREANAKMARLTNGEIDTIGQIDKILARLNASGVGLKDLQADTLAEFLERKDLSDEVRGIAGARFEAADAAPLKAISMRARREEDGCARHVFRFWGAVTGRWSSSGVQVHNVKKSEGEGIQEKLAAVLSGDPDRVRQFGPIMKVIGDVLRAIICARPGFRLLGMDLSGIESCTLAGLAGEGWKVEQWKKFFRTRDPHDDPYFIIGKWLGFADEIARQYGKIADLAFGYGGSVGAWHRFAPAGDTTSDEQIKRYCKIWRKRHPATCRFWRGLDEAVLKTVQSKAITFFKGLTLHCQTVARHNWLFIRLPSGRSISYPFAEIKQYQDQKGGPAIGVAFMDYQNKKWRPYKSPTGAPVVWHGLLTENVVQGIARDLLAATLLRLRAAGYRACGHVHDEIFCEVRKGEGSIEEYKALCELRPDWAVEMDIPVFAKVWERERWAEGVDIPVQHVPGGIITPDQLVKLHKNKVKKLKPARTRATRAAGETELAASPHQSTTPGEIAASTTAAPVGRTFEQIRNMTPGKAFTDNTVDNTAQDLVERDEGAPEMPPDWQDPPSTGDKTYSHFWRAKDCDYPCTPTGVEWRDDADGRIYARVRTPDGAEHIVPNDELVPTQGEDTADIPGPAPPAGSVKDDVPPASQADDKPELRQGNGQQTPEPLGLPAWPSSSGLPDRAEAARFLALLDPTATKFTFQTFDDNKNRKNPTLARILHGSLDECFAELVRLNDLGAGIFITVNETDFKGRATANIVRVRALFGDFDNGVPLPQGGPRRLMDVQSSPTGRHGYWRSNGVALSDFTSTQELIIKRFNGDPPVKDLPRVMRLPGFWHRKGEPFMVRILEVHEDAPACSAADFETDEIKHQAKPNAGQTNANALNGSGGPWGILNTLALANLDKWVPALFGDAAVHQPGTGAYRVSSKALGRDLEEDLSIHPKGITDWGIDDQGGIRQGRYTPIHLVAEFRRIDSDAAFDWLDARLRGDRPSAQLTPDELDEWDAGELLSGPPPAPREWLIYRYFCRTFLSGLVAPGDVGKTTLRLTQAIELATGRELLGQRIYHRRKVLILSFEDDRKELHRRLLAICRHFKIDPQELKGWLFCRDINGPKLAERDDRGNRKIGALDGMLRRAIARTQCALVILDPFVKLHALAENDNPDMNFVCELLIKIAQDCNIAVDSPAHTHKGEIAAGDADARRGGSAQRDASRLEFTLAPMSAEEAKRFGISADERKCYVRLDKAKANLVRAMKAVWFQLVNVPLDNKTELYPEGDELQAIERWEPPETWVGIEAETLNAILDDLDAGMPDGRRYSKHGTATERAAWKVAQKHCPTKTEANCREMIKVWCEIELLFEKLYDDPVSRKQVQGLYVDPSKRPTSSFCRAIANSSQLPIIDLANKVIIFRHCDPIFFREPVALPHFLLGKNVLAVSRKIFDQLGIVEER
jgi:hypothetical protein